IGYYDVGLLVRLPVSNIRLLEFQVGGFPGLSSCLRKHFAGGIEADHAGIRPADSQRGCEVTGAASKIHHFLRRLSLDPGHQVMERPVPVIAQLHILGRIPPHISLLSFGSSAGASLNRAGTKLETNETS